MLDRIAQIHVVANRDDDAPTLVPHSAKVRNASLMLIREAGLEKLRSRNLNQLIDVRGSVKNRIPHIEIDHLIIRGNQIKISAEVFPLLFAVKVVDHQKPATVEKLFQLRR